MSTPLAAYFFRVFYEALRTSNSKGDFLKKKILEKEKSQLSYNIFFHLHSSNKIPQTKTDD